MASHPDESGSQKIRSKAQKSRRRPVTEKVAAKGAVRTGSAKRDRSRQHKSVSYISVSKASARLRESAGAGKSDPLRKADLGLAPREAIKQWLQFAKASGYHRVTGVRRFDTDLDKVDTLIEEEQSLFAFCRAKGLSSFARLDALAKGARPHEGAEHRVFYSLDEDPARVTKLTFPGKYGRIEHTLFLYMERLALFNEFFPILDIRFEDCISDGKGAYIIVSSMRAFSGGHPSLDEIDAFLRAFGFTKYSDGSITIDYRNAMLEIIMRDCHPRNWIKLRDGNLIPVDISPELG